MPSLVIKRSWATFIVDVEIAVDIGLSVEQGHRVATEVRNRLLSKIPYAQDVMVHVNPYQPEQVRRRS